VPADDTVPGDGGLGGTEARVPQWIQQTVGSRNTVTLAPECAAMARAIAGQLVQFRDEAELFLAALVETLQAEVRSKFQTNKRMQESQEGLAVEVFFDEAVVKYLWLAERHFHIVEVGLLKNSPTRIMEMQRLGGIYNTDNSNINSIEETGEQLLVNEEESEIEENAY
jgi:hypothetical protein